MGVSVGVEDNSMLNTDTIQITPELLGSIANPSKPSKPEPIKLLLEAVINC